MDSKVKKGSTFDSNKSFRLYLIFELCLLVVNSISIIFRNERISCCIQFAISFVSAVMMLYIFRKSGQGKRDSRAEMLFAAMMALIVSDTFLCLLAGIIGANRYTDFFGSLGFIVVDVFMALYLGMTRRNNIARAVLCAVLFAALILAEELTFPHIPIPFSYSVLTINMIVAWRLYKKSHVNDELLMAFAMTAFVVCDYGIIVRTLLPVDTLAHTIVYLLVWVCYTAMELLIVLLYGRKKSRMSAVNEA